MTEVFTDAEQRELDAHDPERDQFIKRIAATFGEPDSIRTIIYQDRELTQRYKEALIRQIDEFISINTLEIQNAAANLSKTPEDKLLLFRISSLTQKNLALIKLKEDLKQINVPGAVTESDVLIELFAGKREKKNTDEFLKPKHSIESNKSKLPPLDN